jgi:hypothetical protein
MALAREKADRLHAFKEIRDLLNEEQREKWKAMVGSILNPEVREIWK